MTNPIPTLTEAQKQAVREALEKLGFTIEKLENFSTGLTVMTNIPDRIHVEALRPALPEIVADLKIAYKELGGDSYADWVVSQFEFRPKSRAC